MLKLIRVMIITILKKQVYTNCFSYGVYMKQNVFQENSMQIYVFYSKQEIFCFFYFIVDI
jgi:hypothetical protein